MEMGEKKTTSKLNVAGILRRSPLFIQEKCLCCVRISQFNNRHQNSYTRIPTLQESLASLLPGEWAGCQQGFKSHQQIFLRTPEHVFCGVKTCRHLQLAKSGFISQEVGPSPSVIVPTKNCISSCFPILNQVGFFLWHCDSREMEYST